MIFNQTHTGVTQVNNGERRLVSMSNNFDLYDYYEHLVLKDNNGIIVDSAWHSNYFGENVSMIRDYDNLGYAWIPSNWMTPGEAEPGTEPYVSVDVIFTEILPDGEGSDTQSWPLGEWIEVYNNDSIAVDLAGWKLKASNSRSFTLGGYNFPLQSDAVIQPGAVGLIALNGTNSFYLKQTNDIISNSFASVTPAVGLEFSYIGMIYARAGLGNFQNELNFADSTTLAIQPNIGLGFKFKGIQLDYALTNIGNQSESLYSNVFSLVMDFSIFK